jgi:hypothetical protein
VGARLSRPWEGQWVGISELPRHMGGPHKQDSRDLTFGGQKNVCEHLRSVKGTVTCKTTKGTEVLGEER